MSMFSGDALGKLVLRLSLGGMMLFHGVNKLLHPGSLNFIGGKLTAMGLPEQLAYAIYAGEVLAPLLLIVGLFSRVGGLLIVINMVFAIGLAHGGELLSLTGHGGWALELQGFYLFTALAIVFMGSGRLAVRPD